MVGLAVSLVVDTVDLAVRLTVKVSIAGPARRRGPSSRLWA